MEIGPRGNNVLLVGFMGCGKTSVGRELARMIGFTFVDTDDGIVAAAGRSIPEIFADEGEQAFRRRETEALEGLAEKSAQVVSTGGGLPLQPTNQPVLKAMGLVIWLDATTESILRRVSGSRDRPLLQVEDPESRVRELLAERRPVYEQVSDLVIETDGLCVSDVAYGVAESVRAYLAEEE